MPTTLECSHVAVLVCAYGRPSAGAYYIVGHQRIDIHFSTVNGFEEPEKLFFIRNAVYSADGAYTVFIETVILKFACNRDLLDCVTAGALHNDIFRLHTGSRNALTGFNVIVRQLLNQ